MGTREDLKNSLKKASDEAVAAADALLSEELSALKSATQTDFDALRPKVSDQVTYDKLIAVVSEATQQNISLAELKNRLQQLGKAGLTLAKEVAKLLS